MNKNEMTVNELMKLSKEDLQKMFEDADREFNKINDEEQGKEKSESWEVSVKKRNRLETALDKVIYSQGNFPINPTCGSHELGPVPTGGKWI